MRFVVYIFFIIGVAAFQSSAHAYYPPLREITVTHEAYSLPDPGELLTCSIWDPALVDSVSITFDIPSGIVLDLNVNEGIVVFVEGYSGEPYASYRFVALVYDPVIQEWQYWRQDYTYEQPVEIHNEGGVVFFKQVWGEHPLFTQRETCLTYDPQTSTWIAGRQPYSPHDAYAIGQVEIREGVVAFGRWREWVCGTASNVIYAIFDPAIREWVFGQSGFACDTSSISIESATVHFLFENQWTLRGYDSDTQSWTTNETTPSFGMHVAESERLFTWFTDISIAGPTAWWWDFHQDGTVDFNGRSHYYHYSTCGLHQVDLNFGTITIDADLECLTIVVPDDTPTIQSAVDGAMGHDTILVMPGVYSDCTSIDPSDGQPCCVYTDVPLNIIGGGDDTDSVIIDPQFQGKGIVSDVDVDLVNRHRTLISGLTITNGQQSAVAGATAAGLTAYGDSVVVRDCVIMNNISHTYTDGGFYINAYIVEMSGCDIINNNNDYVDMVGFVSFAGGGTINLSKEAIVQNCRFTGNVCTDKIAGLEIWLSCGPPDTFNIIGCEFSSNTGELVGGLSINACSSSSWIGLQENTFYQNLGSEWGSDISLSPYSRGSVVVDNCIIAFGDGTQAIYVDTTSESTLTLSCTDIFGNPFGDWVGVFAEQHGVSGNISLDPAFCFSENPESPLTLYDTSPCAAENNSECGQIGAYSIGCPESAQTVPGVGEMPVFELSQCAPNPFNPKTQIRFSISKEGPVDLRIVDIAGRIVTELITNTVYKEGRYTISWDGTNRHGGKVSSGVYLCVLEHKGQTVSEKMTLLN